MPCRFSVRLPRVVVAVCLLAAGGFAAPAGQARVVLVGLDGASWNVIDPMLAAGELPNLAAIAAEGVTAELETVEPVTSPVVWTSIATGRTPEHHGVTDFFKTSLSIQTPTVFERLAARGLRVGLYDYLMTWPPAALPNGFVIPGWLRRDDSTTPDDVWSGVGLAPWVNSYDPLKTSEDYRRNSLQEIQRKAPRWIALAERFDLDVGAVSFYAPDSMSHRFWHGAYPEEFTPEIASLATEAQRNALPDAMRGADRAIGEIRASLGPDDTMLIVSDHGFHAQEDPRSVWVSHFATTLERAGLDPERDGFAVLTEFGQLVIRVRPGEFDRADAIGDRLLELIGSQQSQGGTSLYWLVERIDVAPRPPGSERSLGNRFRQWLLRTALELVYDVQIDTSSHAIVLAVPRDGLLESLAAEDAVLVDGNEVPFEQVFSAQLFTGTHDPMAVFFAAGGPLRAQEERGRISVLDVAPLIFHLAGSPVPDDLEGRIPAGWIAPDALAERPITHVAGESMPGIDRTPEAASGEATPDLVEKLRRLGYIE